MRTLKSKGGFTLVELIVVIAILAILAGVAIPVYNGYIKKAQDASAVTELDAIATAAQAANAVAGSIGSIEVKVVKGQDNKTTTTIEVKGENNKALAEDYDSNFVLYMGQDNVSDADEDTTGVFTAKTLDLSGTSYEKGATWNRANSKWEATK